MKKHLTGFAFILFIEFLLVILNMEFIYFTGFVSAISESECDKIYWFVVHNNFEFSNISLTNNNISLDSIYNYPFLCGKELPQKNLPKMIFVQNISEEKTESRITGFFTIYFPLPKISTGETPEYMKYFFERNGNSIRGFSILSLILAVVGIIGIVFISKRLIKPSKTEDEF